MIVGIMGTPIKSSNLGCMALTYSLIIELESISKRVGKKFTYIIFDGSEDDTAKIEMCDALGIEYDRVISGHMSLLYNPLRILKNAVQTIKMISEIRHCDCIVDITGGDSFSDIYGKVTFYGRTNVKILISMLNKPLLLAPQTYGPFQTSKAVDLASKAINRASLVMTRDNLSYDVIKKMTGKTVICCADMAFILPYNDNKVPSNSIKVGINVSKLLYSEDLEVAERNFDLSVDYCEYIDKLLSYLTSEKRFEIYMIPHVGLDHEIHKTLKVKYPSLHLINPKTNPIEMKSVISGMDIFIGARMHGTIASFTTNVATIPTAYSRKFKGLFKSLGYDILIDLQEMDTKSALDSTFKYIDSYDTIKTDAVRCSNRLNSSVKQMDESMLKWFEEICNPNSAR